MEFRLLRTLHSQGIGPATMVAKNIAHIALN
jgi:hypothetical protein